MIEAPGLRVIVAVDGEPGAAFAAALRRAGFEVLLVVDAQAVARLADDRLPVLGDGGLAAAVVDADVIVLQVDRRSLTAGVVALCDRAGVRLQAVCAERADERLVSLFGLASALPLDVEAWMLAEAVRSGVLELATTRALVAEPAVAASRIIAVWGPSGAPGRTTLAIELAVELARGGRHVALVDADTHAPSLALQLGLADEGPGFAAACRQAERGGPDGAELARIAVPLGRGVDVLTGINRPARWPELTESRVAGALEACRGWADFTVVDVAASLERDEEIVSDLEGPRRNAATLAALAAADHVVAVAAADPVGVARFLRAHGELRATIGATPISVVANRLRPGALGIDARGQVRRTLERFGGIRDVWFVPSDARSTDAALLAGRSVADIAPKSPLTLAVRRLVGEALAPSVVAGDDRTGRGIRRSGRGRRAVAA